MNIRMRLVAGSGAVVTLVLILGVVGLVGSSITRREYRDLDLSGQQLRSLLELQSALDRLLVAHTEMLALPGSGSPGPALIGNAQTAIRDVRETTAAEVEAETDDDSVEESSRVDAIASLADSVLLALTGSVGDPDEAHRLARRGTERLVALIDGEVEAESVERDAHRASFERAVSRTTIASIGLPLVAVMVLTLISFAMLRRITRGLRELLAAGRKIGDEDFESRLELTGSDEFTELFSSFNGMAERLARARTEVVDASRKAGMAEIAAAVLHNVGNVLASVNVSVSRVQQISDGSRAGAVGRTAQLLRQQGENLPHFLTEDPRGRQVVDYLVQLGEALQQERSAVREEVVSLRRDIQHISRVIDAQQTHARITTVVDRAPLDEVLESAIRVAGIESSGIGIVTDPAEIPAIRVDRHEMLQILINLLSNAKHAVLGASRRHGRIHVGVCTDNNRLRLSITDDGIGIAAENLHRIFQHGFTTRRTGRGFGLHSCANLAHALGGSLTCSSDGPGRGATFILDLPIPQRDGQHERSR